MEVENLGDLTIAKTHEQRRKYGSRFVALLGKPGCDLYKMDFVSSQRRNTVMFFRCCAFDPFVMCVILVNTVPKPIRRRSPVRDSGEHRHVDFNHEGNRPFNPSRHRNPRHVVGRFLQSIADGISRTSRNPIGIVCSILHAMSISMMKEIGH
ncbi:hypothetical protein L2E82_07965 [Cichorium intybus]|uniref:Uncharacterized protein n=1 Tax=Cichorium intybus TaxID=13427 RepID=A0ACB9G6C6_CICIN|nr:hypothetical protein L2E82_07965 [Cichorium intybus]